MKKLLYICLLSVLVFACKEKNEDPDVEDPTSNKVQILEVYRPLIHHFSSTGCGPCGRWGVPTINRVAELMGDSILPLITHFKYNDPFITSSSMAIEQAFLNEWYSPQIWIENEDRTFPFIYDNIESAAAKYTNVLRERIKHKAEVYVGGKSDLNDDERYDIDLAIQSNTADSLEVFVEIYAMEDGVEASQAGADPFVMLHNKVNRGGHFGDMGKNIKLGPDQRHDESIEFIPCWVCDAKSQYFYLIVWKKVSEGRFAYLNGMVLK